MATRLLQIRRMAAAIVEPTLGQFERQASLSWPSTAAVVPSTC